MIRPRWVLLRALTTGRWYAGPCEPADKREDAWAISLSVWLRHPVCGDERVEVHEASPEQVRRTEEYLREHGCEA